MSWGISFGFCRHAGPSAADAMASCACPANRDGQLSLQVADSGCGHGLNYAWAVVRKVSFSGCCILQETKARGRSAVPARCRGGPESPAPKCTGKSAKARTAAAMERNRRGARKFRERQSKH